MARTKGFWSRFETQNIDANGNSRPTDFLDNDEVRPVRVRDRTWTQMTYFTFWFSAVSTSANWYGASTGMTAGLSMWETVGVSLGGNIAAGILIAINGRAGAVYRIPFPILCRSSFGVYGALWPAFNRAVMAIVWNGVNLVQGAQCVYVMLHAIFPTISDIPDTMGSKSALTSAQMMCFFLIWLVAGAFLAIPIPRLKKLIYVKMVVFAASAVAMLAWTVHLAGGVGNAVSLPSTLTGSDKRWALIRFFFVAWASCSTFISNAADFQRYARKPSDPMLGQLFGFPVSNLIVTVVGNIIAASSQKIFGELVWNPITLLDQLMSGERYTPGNRAGCFFIAAAFAYSAIFSMIFENSIPAGNDIASLLPKYINIKRGFFVCAVISYAICPWYLLSSASVFITFLSSYQIFLSALTGIILCDYYVIHRGQLRISDLYKRDPAGSAYFSHGFNLRAFGAYVIAIAPNFYGFINQMGVSAPLGVQRAYYFAYPMGVVISFLCYWLACLVFRPQVMEPLGRWKEPRDFVDEHDVDVGFVVEAGDEPQPFLAKGGQEKVALQ